jgi:membrane protease YdiL (CAAX protease family)
MPVGALLAFFLLAYGITWTCWIALTKASDAAPAAVRGLLLYTGIFAPALVAVGLTARAQGRSGARALVARVIQWQVGGRWYVFAACYMAAIKLAAALIYRLLIGGWPRFGSEAWELLPVATILSTPFQAGEEIGWRGYALPRLAARMGLAGASIVLGILWAFWHLPLFFFPPADVYGQSLPVYMLQVTAISVAMAWLYGHTKGSLLPVMLFHAAVNNTKDIVPSAVPGATNPFALSSSLVAWLTVSLLWIAAVYFLVRMPSHEGMEAESQK